MIGITKSFELSLGDSRKFQESLRITHSPSQPHTHIIYL